MKNNIECMAIILALLSISSCGKKNSESEITEVRTFAAKKNEERIKLDTYGSVTYRKKNDVTALVEGTVFEQRIKEGSIVHKGDVLLKMKNVQYEIRKTECENELSSATARLREAENNLVQERFNARGNLLQLESDRARLLEKEKSYALIKSNLEKKRMLYEAGGIAQTSYEQAEKEESEALTEIACLKKDIQKEELGFRNEDLLAAGIIPSENEEERSLQIVELNCKNAMVQIELSETARKNAEKNLESINSLIENLTVRSPCDGIVGVLYFESGEHIAENEKILTIIDMSSPYAMVSIQERDLEKIELGSIAHIEIDSIGCRQNSTVDFISPLADSETGNFSLKIPLSNAENKIRLGMFVECSIETKSTGSFFVLPESALVRRDGARIVFYSVRNGFLVQKSCRVEIERDGKFYIEEGIESGELIVDSPAATLKEGLHVKTV